MTEKHLLPMDGFWSYARLDDAPADDGEDSLSRLFSHLQRELQRQCGERVTIFRDVGAIPPGAVWRQRIAQNLNGASFLIPIMTPGFVRSEWCSKEVAIFLKREKALRDQDPTGPDGRRVFPIWYIDIEGIPPRDPEVLARLQEQQWLDFRELRLRQAGDPEVRAAIVALAAEIKTLLLTPVPGPPPEPAQTAHEAAVSQLTAAGAPRDQAPTGRQRMPRWAPWAAAASLVAALLAADLGGRLWPASAAHGKIVQNSAQPPLPAVPQPSPPLIAAAPVVARAPSSSSPVAAAPDPAPQVRLSTEDMNSEAVRKHGAGATQGDANEIIALAWDYVKGLEGVQVSNRKAFDLFKVAADQKNSYAQNMVASYYQTGFDGLKPDLRESEKYYNLSAAKGLPNSQFRLAQLIMKRDPKRAVGLLQDAARQGYGDAMLELGRHYALLDDDATALWWFQKTVRHPDPDYPVAQEAADAANALLKATPGLVAKAPPGAF